MRHQAQRGLHAEHDVHDENRAEEDPGARVQGDGDASEAYAAGSKGRLLELWAEPGSDARRSGWTAVADGPHDAEDVGYEKTNE